MNSTDTISKQFASSSGNNMPTTKLMPFPVPVPVLSRVETSSSAARHRLTKDRQLPIVRLTRSKIDEYEVELSAIHSAITNRPNSRINSSRPKLSLNGMNVTRKEVKSIEMDILNEKSDLWSLKRSLHVPEFNSNDKRLLRRFFNALDDDGSGEVSFTELINPLVSSGMYRSSQEVIRLLSKLDSNKSGGIDFNEFLSAITHDNFGDKSKLKTLIQCTSHPLGIHMDTLLSVERRKRLMTYVTERSSTHYRSMSDDDRLLADLVCNENIDALEVVVKQQEKIMGSSTYVDSTP